MTKKSKSLTGSARKLRRVFGMRIFLWLIFAAVVAAAFILGGKYLPAKKDFGTAILIKQSKSSDIPITYKPLRKSMIENFVMDKELLEAVAKKVGWAGKYETLKDAVKVQERISSPNSFSLTVNTGDTGKSLRVAYMLAELFIGDYRKTLNEQNLEALKSCTALIAALELELAGLDKQLAQIRKDKKALMISQDPLALTRALELNEGRFVLRYADYIGKFDKMYSDLKTELNLALQIYQEKDATVKALRKKLGEIEKLRALMVRNFSSDGLNIYSDDFGTIESKDIPVDIKWLYDNIRILRSTKNAQSINDMIRSKEQALHDEKEKEVVIRKIVQQPVCDVFIREIVYQK